MKKRIAPILAVATLWVNQSIAQTAASVSDTELSLEIE
jgi:hypothetical protein